jgi:catechol 2,3-dioxygenase-like lactoylglutathione lyase family enzyme
VAKVTGLGGLFYKVADPERTRAWYREMLGIGGEWGASFRWADGDGDAYSMLSPFPPGTDYFVPSPAQFMINLRVDDLDTMIDELSAKGVDILGLQDEEYGRFAWIIDCDGLKIELWQQIGPAPRG